MLDGFLVVDKPAGMTSHDVVAILRRILQQKKIGHTGTLDPFATGVLPIALGEGTKAIPYLDESTKEYGAVMRLGISTDTLDSAGEVVDERPVNVTEAQVREVVQAFVGEQEQVPPMFSAKKVDGKRLYELARQGIEVEREAKRVSIRSIEVISVTLPDVVIDVRCSAGTYVRVLARDIGERLGCGAHLKALTRLAAGPFTLADAVPLQQIIDDPETARQRVLPVGRALSMLPRIDVPPDVARMIQDGHQLTVADLRTLDTPSFAGEEVVGLWADGGELIAVARTLLAASELPISRRDRQALKTERVLAPRR